MRAGTNESRYAGRAEMQPGCGACISAAIEPSPLSCTGQKEEEEEGEEEACEPRLS